MLLVTRDFDPDVLGGRRASQVGIALARYEPFGLLVGVAIAERMLVLSSNALGGSVRLEGVELLGT
jgi:hypothetical protein